MIFLHWQRKQCQLYGSVTQHFVLERPSLSGGGLGSISEFLWSVWTCQQCTIDAILTLLGSHCIPILYRWCVSVHLCKGKMSVICHLQSTGVQKRKWHNYEPSIPSRAQHRSRQAFLRRWMISDAVESFMESEKICTGLVIKAEIYCHWQVNLLWYLRWCLFGNGQHHKYLSRNQCCSLSVNFGICPL